MPQFKRLARRCLQQVPGFKQVYAEIDLARQQRDEALVERDSALAQAGQSPVRLFVPPGHFYSPIVDPQKANAHFERIAATPVPSALPGIELNLEKLRQMWRTLLPYLVSCPFGDQARRGLHYGYDNPNYSYGDASILHAMLRHFTPKRVIEIGSGWSSACMVDTVDEFLKENECQFTFVEPYPQLLERLIGSAKNRVSILPCEVQLVPLETFDSLERNDILLIDSSHVLATGSDVCLELFAILPRLRPGVLVHFHDVFWPFEYPRYWVSDENRSWNEIYGLRAFLAGNQEWKILFFNDYFQTFASDEIAKTFPLFMRNPGGALWLVKT